MNELARPSTGPRLLWHVLECMRSAVYSIRAHALRSFLTTLGVVIGVASTICVVALVQGMSRSISDQFQSIGASTLTLRSYTELSDTLRGKVNRLRITDLDEIKQRVQGIKDVTPIVLASGRSGSEIRNGAHTAGAQMYGTTATYQDVQQSYPRLGRFLTPSDDASRRRVVVLGEEVRRSLRLPENPIGQFIQIGGEWFKIVGVLEARGELWGANQDNFLLMPFQTALALNGVFATPDLWISFRVSDLAAIEDVKQQVTLLARRLHVLGAGQPNDFVIESPDTLAKAFERISLIVTLVVASIVSISLVVGGIGIMNIMLASVTERTREIGIAKALGAPRSFILTQFLIESATLSAIGGCIGILIGFALSFAIASAIPDFPDPSVPWWVAAGAAMFSGLIGVTFGILPANKAANLAPIDALRYE